MKTNPATLLLTASRVRCLQIGVFALYFALFWGESSTFGAQGGVGGVFAPPEIRGSDEIVMPVGKLSKRPLTVTGRGVVFSATSLPRGIGINNATGELSGVLMEEGRHTITITAYNNLGRQTVTKVIVGVNNSDRKYDSK